MSEYINRQGKEGKEKQLLSSLTIRDLEWKKQKKYVFKQPILSYYIPALWHDPFGNVEFHVIKRHNVLSLGPGGFPWEVVFLSPLIIFSYLNA